MPRTVAPPPFTREVAAGRWPPDRAPFHEAPPGFGTAEPVLQTPVASARTVVAGVAFSAAAVLIAGIAVGTAAALRLLLSGDGRMTLEPSSAALLLAGFAAAVVATLAVPTGRGAPRPTTLGLAAAVSLAWPVCGFPLPAAVAAVVAVGLALARDLRRPGGRRVRGRPALGLFGGLATAFVIGGLAAAETHRIDLEAAKPAARPAQRVTPSRETARTPTARTEAASPAPARRGTRRAVPAPTEPPAAAAGLPRPETFVRDYYEHLDAKRFRRAWASLSAGVRASFGGFDGWRGGYRRTIFSTPSEFAVAGSTVTHVLVARDRGCPERRFRVRWRLEPAGGAWTVVALSASPLDEVVCR